MDAIVLVNKGGQCPVMEKILFRYCIENRIGNWSNKRLGPVARRILDVIRENGFGGDGKEFKASSKWARNFRKRYANALNESTQDESNETRLPETSLSEAGKNK